MRLARCTSVVVALALGSSMPMMSGCAVGMAMSGKENIDTSIMFPGSPRQVVIAKAGPPEISTNEGGKRVDTYFVVKGNQPSVARAVVHALLDLLTFFLWEFIGTAWEFGAGQSEKSRYVLTYDKEDRIEDVRVIKGVAGQEGQ